MLSKETVSSVLTATKLTCDPEKNFSAYTNCLVISSLEALGFDSEELALGTGMNECIDAVAAQKDPSYILYDISGIFSMAYALGKEESGTKHALMANASAFGLSADQYNDLGIMLQSGLEGYTDKFLGIVHSVEQAKKLVGNGSVLELHVTKSAASLSPYFEYLEESSPFWKAMINSELPGDGIVVWDNPTCYTTGLDGEMPLPYRNPFPLFPNLDEVVELPISVGGWIFGWRSNKPDSVTMIDLPQNVELVDILNGTFPEMLAHAHSEQVSHTCVAVNRNFCPRYYLSHQNIEVKAERLRHLTAKIQRGTSLTGKDLNIRGTIYERRADENARSSEKKSVRKLMSGIGGPAPLGLKRGSFTIYEDDRWYIDNSCIQGNGSVEPKVITEIPEGQSRYTVMPEDGLCVLIPRNGKGIAPFVAEVPTLISDNLIIARINAKSVNPDYLGCVVRSAFLRTQISAAKKPLTKNCVEDLIIPIVDDQAQQAIVEREKKIHDEIARLYNEITLLETRDSLDVFDALEVERERPAHATAFEEA